MQVVGLTQTMPAGQVPVIVPQALPTLLAGTAEDGLVDAHVIQPFYAGLLARACGLEVDLAAEGDAIVVSAA